MRYLSLTALLIPLIAGCVTPGPTKEQLGSGRFAHIRTLGNNLFGQITYRYSLDCELNLREKWSQFNAGRAEVKCSTEDLTAQMPYRIVITNSSNYMVPLEYRFVTSDACEATARDIQSNANSNGNAEIAKFCTRVVTTAPPKVAEESITPKSGSNATAESRLKELKRLFDAGLITSEVYTERQKAILQ